MGVRVTDSLQDLAHVSLSDLVILPKSVSKNPPFVLRQFQMVRRSLGRHALAMAGVYE